MQSARKDLAQLEKQAANDADVCQADLLGQVTDLFFATAGQHTDNDVASFGDVMERLAYNLDVDPRAAFAARIADAAKASPRLLRRLATDEIVVAEPVLSRSKSLSERDLEEIAGTCEPDHLLALSRRPSVPAELADVIVTRGDRKALVALAGNAGLVLSRRGFTQLLRRAETNRELQRIIDHRGVVGADMVTRLWLRMTGWQNAEEPAEIDEAEPEEAPAPEPPAPEPATEEEPEPDASPRFEKLAEEEPEEEQSEDNAVLLAAARANDVPAVIECLCTLSEMDRPTIEHLLLEVELRPFSVFCKAHEIDGTTFAALAGLRVEAGKLQAAGLVKAMRRYASMSTARAQELLSSVQR